MWATYKPEGGYWFVSMDWSPGAKRLEDEPPLDGITKALLKQYKEVRIARPANFGKSRTIGAYNTEGKLALVLELTKTDGS